MRITRKQAREDEILRLLANEPAGLSNQQLADKVGLPYAAIRQATWELEREQRLAGEYVGSGYYAYIVWRLLSMPDGKVHILCSEKER